MEIRNILLDTGGKAIFINKVVKNLAELCLCPGILCKVELTSEIISMAEAISKQSIGGEAWFLLTAHSKMQEGRNDLKTELLIKI